MRSDTGLERDHVVVIGHGDDFQLRRGQVGCRRAGAGFVRAGGVAAAVLRTGEAPATMWGARATSQDLIDGLRACAVGGRLPSACSPCSAIQFSTARRICDATGAVVRSLNPTQHGELFRLEKNLKARLR